MQKLHSWLPKHCSSCSTHTATARCFKKSARLCMSPAKIVDSKPKAAMDASLERASTGCQMLAFGPRGLLTSTSDDLMLIHVFTVYATVAFKQRQRCKPLLFKSRSLKVQDGVCCPARLSELRPGQNAYFLQLLHAGPFLTLNAYTS